MKTNKIDALIYQLTSGKATSDRAKILLEISKKPITIENLVLLGYKIQTASARCSELEELGMIKKMYNPTNSFSWFLFVEDPQEREELRNRIANDKKAKYFAKGFEMGYFKWDNNGQIIANFELIL
jgi:hypothetical protein